jgi:hypothetical protein
MSDSEQTAGQAKSKNSAAMGAALGEIYSELWQQLCALHRKWGEYVALYGTNPQRIDLLNATAPAFFRTVQDCLWEDTLLHLARITDSPSTAGKENLSFRRIPSLVPDPHHCAQLKALVEKAVDATAFARDWRNRRLAHRDLMLALDRPTEPLAAASRAHVKDALSALGEVLNFLSDHYLQSTTAFEFAAEPTAGGASTLLYYLRAGKNAEHQRRERLKNGMLTKEDLDHSGI